MINTESRIEYLFLSQIRNTLYTKSQIRKRNPRIKPIFTGGIKITKRPIQQAINKINRKGLLNSLETLISINYN